MSSVVRLTTAQALVRFLAAQHVERDGQRHAFFAGVLGIFGHGNLAGVGQALQQQQALRFVPARNEQSMVHLAAGYARGRRRLGTWACTSSIGPGATNMVTAAAGATINRLPVLLLPGDTFATRRPDPVLQQLEQPWGRGVTVNDALAPVCRLFDRVQRPEQLWSALTDAMRVLTDPADTGAVTIALPQDVQAEAHDFPAVMFEPRTWQVERPAPPRERIRELAERLRAANQPLLVAGGGVAYSEAEAELAAFASATGVPVATTQAGMGAIPWDHEGCLGGVGVTGTSAANEYAAAADLVIGVGTRWADFTTASRTGFRADATLVAINVARVDAVKHAAAPIVADARAALRALAVELEGWHAGSGIGMRVGELRRTWQGERTRVTGERSRVPAGQGTVIGAVNDAVGSGGGTVVCAAGSMPGDLHRLWHAETPDAYHVEYGFSCMGYEIPGAIGMQLALPRQHVVAMVGDGSWLMMHGELVTAIQERIPLTVVLVDNHGYGSIGALSRSLGCGGFGTALEHADGASMEIDYVASAAALGAHAVRAGSADDVACEVRAARERGGVTVVVVETDPSRAVPSYGEWWDVPVPEVASSGPVGAARARYEQQLQPVQPAP